MSDYKNRIKSFQLSIKSNNGMIKEKTIQLGDLLSNSPKKIFQDTDTAEYYEKIKDMRSRIPELENRIMEIKTQIEKVSTIKSIIKDKEKNIAELEKGFSESFELIGQKSFENYKARLVQNPNLEIIFKNLIKLEEKEEYFQDNLNKKPAEDANFFDQMTGAVKGFYQSQRLNMINHQYKSQFRMAGQKLMKIDLPEEIFTDDLRQPIEEYQSLIGEIDKIKNEIENDQKEISDIESSFQESFSGPPLKSISKLEKEIQSLNDNIQEQILLLGQGFLSMSDIDVPNKKDISAIKQEIQALIEDNKKAENMITKLEAAITVDNLNAKIEQSNRKISSLKEDIKKTEKTIDELDKEIIQLNKEKKQFITKAGSVLN